MATAELPVPEDGPLLELDDVPPPDDQEAVSAEVRALMGRHRVSQARLAAAAGLSQRGMSERLNGKTNFTIREMGRIARFFGTTLGRLAARAERSEDGFLDVTRIEYPPQYLDLQLSLFAEVEPPPADMHTPGVAPAYREAA